MVDKSMNEGGRKQRDRERDVTSPSKKKAPSEANRWDKGMIFEGEIRENFRDGRREENLNFANENYIRLVIFEQEPEGSNCLGLREPLAVPRENFHDDYSFDPSGSMVSRASEFEEEKSSLISAMMTLLIFVLCSIGIPVVDLLMVKILFLL